MTQLTPEELQQARAVLDHRARWQDEDERAFVLRVIDALTEEVADLRAATKTESQELFKERAASGAIVEELQTKLVALTEQQPEPPQQESSLAQRIAAQCTCEYPYPREIWAGHHPNCVTEQPEPVDESREADRIAFAAYRMYMSDWRADGMNSLSPPLDLDELENPNTESIRLVWGQYLRRTRAAFGSITRKAGA